MTDAEYEELVEMWHGLCWEWPSPGSGTRSGGFTLCTEPKGHLGEGHTCTYVTIDRYLHLMRQAQVSRPWPPA